MIEKPVIESESMELEEILNDFFLESTELIEKIDQDLLTLEKSPEQPDLINRIFRSFHTLKGMASFLGFEQTTKVAHHAEEVLNKLRKVEIKASPPIIDSLLKTSDLIKDILLHLRTHHKEDNLTEACYRNISNILEELSHIALIKTEKKADQEKKSVNKKIGELLIEDKLINQEQLEEALDKQSKTPKLGEILIHEGVISKDQLQSTLQKQEKSSPDNQTIRVEVNRLDSLMNLVGELVLSRNRLLRLHTDILQKFPAELLLEELSETTSRLNQITTDLQSAIMKTRLIPISKIFNKCPRMVRDLAQSAHKKINLVIAGENTELDKSVIEQIHDPLIHLLRNSVDHGLESPEERIEKGKSPTGMVKLSSYYEGNQVVIEIEDDGRGIDAKILKKKAVEKGILSQADALTMSDKDALQLIFIPGFTTAQSITKISGRGVGMDVVRSNIQRLNGLINLDSVPGQGTKILLKIPLTLAIIQVLIVQIGQETFALPLTFVHEVIRTHSVRIRHINHKEIIQFRGEIFPLIRLYRLFDVQVSPGEQNGKYIVIVGIGEKKLALMINLVVGQEELVIKSACNYANTHFLGGASIMGDGQVVFIIDAPSMVNIYFNNKKETQEFQEQVSNGHNGQLSAINGSTDH